MNVKSECVVTVVCRRKTMSSGWQQWSWRVKVERWPTRLDTRPNYRRFVQFYDFITTLRRHHHLNRRLYHRHHRLLMVAVVLISRSLWGYRTWWPPGTSTEPYVINRCVWRQRITHRCKKTLIARTKNAFFVKETLKTLNRRTLFAKSFRTSWKTTN